MFPLVECIIFLTLIYFLRRLRRYLIPVPSTESVTAVDDIHTPDLRAQPRDTVTDPAEPTNELTGTEDIIIGFSGEDVSGRNEISSVTVSDAVEGYSTVDVEVIVAGVDLKALSVEDKVFNVRGREYPMSRFGSWVFQDVESLEQAKNKLCIDGGIIASLLWGLLEICPQVNAWVKDVEALNFTLQITATLKYWLLQKIILGELARDLENTLRERIPVLYTNIRIRRIGILGGDKRQKNMIGESEDSRPGRIRTSTAKISHESSGGSISDLMDSQNYERAYARLKRLVVGKTNDSECLQALIRLGICCFHLHKLSEMHDTAKRILEKMENVRNCIFHVKTLNEDMAMLTYRLQSSGMYMVAVNILLEFNNIIRKIDDRNERIEEILSNVIMCSTIVRSALASNPLTNMLVLFREKIRLVEAEVEYIRYMKKCDQLIQSRAVYYALYALSRIKCDLGDHIHDVPSERQAIQFANAASSWADLPHVMSTVERYPDVALMLVDPSFRNTVKEICDNPAVLEKRICDPRIRRINAILNSDIHIFNPMSAFTGFPSRCSCEMTISYETNPKMTVSIDNKNEAAKEKQAGNAAYRNQEYGKALEHFEKAIVLDPSDALLHNNQAAVFISQNKLEEARSSCIAAARILKTTGIRNVQVEAKIMARLARVEFLSKCYNDSMGLYQISLHLHEDVTVRQQMEECKEALLTDHFTNFMRFQTFSRMSR